MKNLLAKVMVILFSTVMLGACSSVEKTPTVEEINKKIIEAVDVSELNIVDKDKLEKFYDITEKDIEDFVLYSPPSNIEAAEILVLKLKDTNNVEEIKGKILDRVEKKSESFKDYIPEEYYLVEKHLLIAKGNYVIFATHEDWEKIKNAFNNSF